MGFLSHLDRLPLFERLSRRIQAVSKVVEERFRPLKRTLQALSFLAASGILGIWAENLARSEASRAWERSHPPSPPIWRHALGSRGFRELQETGDKKDLSLSQAVSRSLPSSLDETNAAWVSGSSHWIAVALPSGSELPSVLNIFCSECKKAPEEWKSWESLGTGWAAFEAVLSRLDQLPKTRNKAPEKRKMRVPSDSREIRY